MFEFKLPDLGEGIHEGEILKWHVQPGATVMEDAPIVDIETDKAAVTIPSPVSGKVVSIAGKPGDILRVGQVLITIDEGSSLRKGGEKQSAPESSMAGKQPSESPPEKTPDRPVPAAPATRRLARELGVNLALVTATGPGGRVTPDDVKNFAARKPDDRTSEPQGIGSGPVQESNADPHPLENLAQTPHSKIPFLDLEPLPDFTPWGLVTREPLRSIRRRVAHKMVTSMILIPHVAHMDEADVTSLEEFRRNENEKGNGPNRVHLTLLPFVVKAITAGLRASPLFNSSLDPFKEEIIYKNFFNIGIAVETGNGLLVPVVKNAPFKSIKQIAIEIHDLAVKAREGKIDPADLRGGTFTITNIGPLGGTGLIPAINYPEVAILGMGRVQEKPVVREGKIVIRKMLPLTLSFDHRIADGADAAGFVNGLIALLTDPNKLLLET